MYITITGELGSGKSTIAKLLQQNYGFELYSTGSIQREIAKEKGITTLELNQQMSNDIHNKYDKMIDEKTVELSQKSVGKDIVFDSRMAWHFVENSLKVYVTVDPCVAAGRVIQAGRGAEEQYASLEEATHSLLKRKRLEDSRFAEMYLVNTTDFHNYDLIVDSTAVSAEELTEMVVEKAKSGRPGQEIYLSPQRLFPTRTVQDCGLSDVAASENESGQTPVKVIESNGFYSIMDGHHRVSSAIRSGKKLIPAILSGSADPEAEQSAALSEEVYREWEAFHAFTFFSYPETW